MALSEGKGGRDRRLRCGTKWGQMGTPKRTPESEHFKWKSALYTLDLLMSKLAGSCRQHHGGIQSLAHLPLLPTHKLSPHLLPYTNGDAPGRRLTIPGAPSQTLNILGQRRKTLGSPIKGSPAPQGVPWLRVNNDIEQKKKLKKYTHTTAK